MSENTCSFTLDAPGKSTDLMHPDIAEEWTTSAPPQDVDDGWTCPHPVHEAGRCLFHLPPEEVADQNVSEALCRTIRDESAIPEFRGAQLSELDLSGRTLRRTDDRTVDFSHVIVEGKTDFSDAVVDAPLCFEDAALKNDLDLSEARFSGHFDCTDAQLGRRVSLDKATFEAPVTFEGAEGGYINGKAVTFEDDVSFAYSTWTANAGFPNSEFDGDLSFARATFERKLDLTRITTTGTTRFDDVTIEGRTEISATEFGGDVSMPDGHFAGEIDASHAIFEGRLSGPRATFEEFFEFEGGTCRGEVNFDAAHFDVGLHAPEAEFGGDVICRRADFEGTAWFVLATIRGTANFSATRFADETERAQSGTHFRNVTYGGPAIYTDATFEHASFFFNAEFEASADFSGCSFRHFQFGARVADETSFSRATFYENAIFKKSVFEGPASFDHAEFEHSAEFADSTFGSTADFYHATFTRQIDFEDVTFAHPPEMRDVTFRMAPQERLRHAGERFDPSDSESREELSEELSDLTTDSPIHAHNVMADIVSMSPRRAASIFDDPLELMRAASDQADGEQMAYILGLGLSSSAAEPHDVDDPEDLPTIVTDAVLFAAYTASDEQLTFAHLADDIGRIDYLVPLLPDRYDEAFSQGTDKIEGSELLSVLVQLHKERAELMLEEEDEYIKTIMSHIVTGLLAYQAIAS